MSVTGFITKMLQKFKHSKPPKPQDAPYPAAPHKYRKPCKNHNPSIAQHHLMTKSSNVCNKSSAAFYIMPGQLIQPFSWCCAFLQKKKHK